MSVTSEPRSDGREVHFGRIHIAGIGRERRHSLYLLFATRRFTLVFLSAVFRAALQLTELLEEVTLRTSLRIFDKEKETSHSLTFSLFQALGQCGRSK